jgi:copper(I)-binding protein
MKFLKMKMEKKSNFIIPQGKNIALKKKQIEDINT